MTVEMPPLGTAEMCAFCRVLVSLRRAPDGWYYWTTPDEPVDGRRRCLGGQMRRHDGNVITYHVPFPTADGVRRTVRYDPDGLAQSA